MIALTPLSVPNAIGVVSAALDLTSLDMSSEIAVQLDPTATNTDTVDVYGSNIFAAAPSLTVLAQLSYCGSIGQQTPNLVTNGTNPAPGSSGKFTGGQSLVQLPAPRTRYLYVVRRSGTTAGNVLRVTGQETSGTASGGTVTSVTGTPPITSTGGNTPAIGITAATEVASGSMSAADKAKLDALVGAGAPVFVYQQGGVAGPGVYTSFASAYAAMVAVAFLLPEMVVDGSLGQPVMPAGTYDLGGFTFRAPGFNSNFQINLQDGAHITCTRADNFRLDGIVFNWQHTTAACIALAGTSSMAIEMINAAGITADISGSATKPFVALTGTATFNLQCSSEFGELVGSAAAPILNAAAGTFGFINIGQGTTMADDCLTGAGSIKVTIEDPSVTYSQTQLGASAITWSVGGGTIGTLVQAANPSGTQSIPDHAGTFTVVGGWTASKNSSPLAAGSFNAATGVFTVPVPGMYEVIAGVEYPAAAAILGAEFTLSIFQNGGARAAGVYTCPVAALSQKRQVTVHMTINCAVGDTLDVRANQNSGSGAETLTNAGPRNYLSITRQQGF